MTRQSLRHIAHAASWSAAVVLMAFAVTASASTPTPTPGLVAAYSFDEGSGNVAHDSSGAGNDGTLGGGVGWTRNAKYGPSALSFPGTAGSYVTVPSSASLRIPNALTLEAWVYPTKLDGTLRLILSKEMAYPYANRAWGLYGIGWDHTNKPAEALFDNDTNLWFACRANNALTLNAWNHVAVTYDKATGLQIVYLNGMVTRTCVEGSHSIKITNQPLRIGGDSLGNMYFVGAIDDVRIWNYARSAAQIQVDRDMSVPPSPPSATPTPTSTPTPTATQTPSFEVNGRVVYYSGAAPVDGAVVDLQGASARSMETDSQGRFAFADVDPGTWQIEPHKLGDFRGAVSALDAVYALQSDAGMRNLSSDQQLACDVDGDGSVTAADAAAILDVVVQRRLRLPVAQICDSDWAFVPIPARVPAQLIMQPTTAGGMCQRGAITYQPLSASTGGQDFAAILFGDCSGNWAAESSPSASGATQGRYDAWVGGLHGRRGLMRLRIYVDATVPFYALDMTLHYDPTRLLPLRVRSLGGADQAVVQFGTDGSGTMRLALASPTPITANGSAVLVVQLRSGANPAAVPGVQLMSGSIDEQPLTVEAPSDPRQ